ncbi:MAG: pyridoxal phosphate-dependent aminotransferase [Bryobacteraceae bacterium]
MNSKAVQMTSPRPSRLADRMPGYKPADFSINAGTKLLQLSRNESAIRLPHAWLEAARRATTQAVLYPDPECQLLRRAIADTFYLDSDRIICGAGLMECLQTLALAYLDPGDRVIIPEHAFAYFRQVCELAGADVNLLPEKDLRVDVRSILEAADDSTKMVIFANPGNPTGTYVCKQGIAELRNRLSAATLLVIDEAYAEFVCEDRYEPLFDLTDSANVIVLRTFSKMYGLAGFRVAWGYGPKAVVNNALRVQIPAAVNSVAQSIAAAAVADQPFVQSFKRELLRIRRRFINQLRGIPRVSPVESETNFVLLRTNSEPDARDLDGFLRQHGIVLRTQPAVGLSNYLRATIGTEEQMQYVAATIRQWCTK